MAKHYIHTSISQTEFLAALDWTEENISLEQALIFDEWMTTRLNLIAQQPKGGNFFDESLPGVRWALEPNSEYKILYEEIEVGPISIRVVKIVHPKRNKESIIIELIRELL